eukprot:2826864-Rhodomonas_salina.3
MMRRTVHLAVAFALVSEAVGFGLNLPMGLSARSAVKHGALGATAADRDSSALNRRALFQGLLVAGGVQLFKPSDAAADLPQGRSVPLG